MSLKHRANHVFFPVHKSLTTLHSLKNKFRVQDGISSFPNLASLCFLSFISHYTITRASLVAQMVKNLPAMQETWVQSLGWEGPLEKGMATHSSILAWKIPWTEEPGRLQSIRSQRIGYE